MLPHIDRTREVRICKNCFDSQTSKLVFLTQDIISAIRTQGSVPTPTPCTPSLGLSPAQNLGVKNYINRHPKCLKVNLIKSTNNWNLKNRKKQEILLCLSSGAYGVHILVYFYSSKPVTDLPEDPKVTKPMSNATQPPVKLPIASQDQGIEMSE